MHLFLALLLIGPFLDFSFGFLQAKEASHIISIFLGVSWVGILFCPSVLTWGN